MKLVANAAAGSGARDVVLELEVPRVQAIHSGPMYHTSGDTLDTISTPGLERAARFYAFFISEIAKTELSALQTK